MTGDSRVLRVLIADDHPVVRHGLRGLIAAQRDMEVVGEAADGDAAVKQALKLRPNVILMDVIMPGKDGITAITEIVRELPDARILVLTGSAEDDQVGAALKLGALGYLLKGASPEQLLDAVREIARGDMILGPEAAAAMARALKRPSTSPPVSQASRLTERELEVLRLLARGLSNQEIAQKLFLSERTARNHVSSILTKLNVESRTQAALLAVRERLL